MLVLRLAGVLHVTVRAIDLWLDGETSTPDTEEGDIPEMGEICKSEILGGNWIHIHAWVPWRKTGCFVCVSCLGVD